MSGVTMLFYGDFEVPIVPRGINAEELKPLARNTRMHLAEYMRVQTGGNTKAQEFFDLLLNIGEGKQVLEKEGVSLIIFATQLIQLNNFSLPLMVTQSK